LHESLRLRRKLVPTTCSAKLGAESGYSECILIIKSRHSQCNLRDELFEQQERRLHHRTVAKAAKSARWDGLTFDIKGEIIILSSRSQLRQT
jgi:hypothetical protein